MGVDTGYMGFSIELDLPNRDPTDNALFLYPQLPVGDAGFLEGYFMLAEVANVDYNVDITGSTATLTYDDGLHKLDASWDLDTGFLTHWFGQSLEENDSFVFEFSLLKAFDPFNSNLHWGASAGQGNTYDVLDVLNPDDGGDKIYFDPQDTTNYIQTGDKLYVEPTEFTIFAENHQHPNQQDTNGPHVHYDMEGTQGSATGVVMYFLDNPDDNEGGGGGPPFLNFHFLLGNADFYEFIGYLISSMGGTLTVTQTEIIFSFSMTQGSITASLNSVWDISTGVLVEYQVDLPQMGEDPAMKLHLKLVGEGNLINAAGAQNSSSADDGGLFGLPFIPGDNPIFYLLSTLMVVPILRRRKQLK
ncbi:MAG: hypothetical protein OEZ01_10470, partial [Candidatus Heimdallarchaeota archaeon]|nr:hypothetical protein [Candidatus Heimdallarchaeota archaeon]